MEDELDPICGTALVTFHEFYISHVHGYATILICVAGSAGNVFNIIVLTRKTMVSPINVLLTALAVADLAVLLDFIPYSWHAFWRPDSHSFRDRHTYGWAMLILWHSNFIQVAHAISVWLTVLLALWRYIAIAYPLKNCALYNMKTTCVAILCVCVLAMVLCIPTFLSFSIMPVQVLLDDGGFTTNDTSTGTNSTVYMVTLIEIVKPIDSTNSFDFIVYGFLIKLVPSFTITALSLRLIYVLLKAKKNRRRLTSGSTNDNFKEGENQMDRTTYILLTVVVLLLATEVPDGILASLSAILGEKFWQDCYQTTFEMFDFMILTISAINFVLYYTMSKKFRANFQSLFNRHSQSQTTSSQNTRNVSKSASVATITSVELE